MANRVWNTILHHLRRSGGNQPGDAVTDRQLLERFAAQRDESAFEALVQRHGPLVWTVCRGQLPCTQDAEDAFQATFLVLLRKAASVPWRESVGGWLHTVAYRVAREARLRLTQQRGFRLDETRQPDPAGHPADAGQRELWQILTEELERLPVKDRGPLVLCYLEGKTHEEAARELGVPRGSLARRLEQARERLRQGLLRRGLSGSAVALALAEGGVEATVPAMPIRQADRLLSGGGVSEAAVHLAEGALQVMKLTKIKTMVLLLATVLAAGVGVPALAGLLSANRLKPVLQQGEAAAAATVVAERDDNVAPTDRHGDPLPADAVSRLGTLRFRHVGDVRSLAFAPSGRTVASFRSDGGVLITDVTTGAAVRRWEFKPDNGYRYCECGIFSADGKLLAVSAGKITYIIDATTGKELRRLQGHRGMVVSMAFSRDGKRLASGANNSLFQEDGTLLKNNDGDQTIRIWDVETGKQLHTLAGTKDGTASLAFSPDGRTLASGGGGYKDDAVCLWDVATAKQLHRLEGHSSPIGALAFTADGLMLASGSADGAIRFWATASGQFHSQREAPGGAVQSLSYSPDGKFLAAGGAGSQSVRLWETCLVCDPRIWHGPAACNQVTFSADGKLLAAGGRDSTIRVWDTKTGREHSAAAQGTQGSVANVAVSPDGRTAATTGGDNLIRIWETATGRLLHQSERLEAWATMLAFLPDGKTLVGVVPAKDPIRLWDTTGKELRRFGGPFNQHEGHAVLSPDGKTVAIGGSVRSDRGPDGFPAQVGLVRLWQVMTGKEFTTIRFEADVEMASPAAFSADGRTLAVVAWKSVGFGIGSPKVRLWDLQARKELRWLKDQPEWCVGPRFLPDGRSLLTEGDHESPALVWELASGTVRRRLPLPRTRGNSSIVSPDGRLLATRKGDAVYLWDADSDARLHVFRGHAGDVYTLAFSPDGKRLVSGGEDTTALVWDLEAISRPKRPQAELPPEKVRQLWEDLAGDATKAYQAIASLRASPEVTVTFLASRLRPVAEPDAKQLARWLAELDDGSFAVREKAQLALANQGDAAEPALRERLAQRPALEVQRRIEQLLDKLATEDSPAAETLRTVRAVEVLEQIKTTASRDLLRTLARGTSGACLTREAQAALARLADPGLLPEPVNALVEVRRLVPFSFRNCPGYRLPSGLS